MAQPVSWLGCHGGNRALFPLSSSSSSCSADGCGGGMMACCAQHSQLVGEGTHELAWQVKPSLPGKSLPAFYDCLPLSQGCLFGSSRSGPGWLRRAVFLWDFITCFVSQGVSAFLQAHHCFITIHSFPSTSPAQTPHKAEKPQAAPGTFQKSLWPKHSLLSLATSSVQSHSTSF